MRIHVTGDYRLVEHRKPDLTAQPGDPLPEPYAVTLISNKRQLRKRVEREHGLLSGRQWKRYLKRAMRAYRAMQAVPLQPTVPVDGAST